MSRLKALLVSNTLSEGL